LACPRRFLSHDDYSSLLSIRLPLIMHLSRFAMAMRPCLVRRTVGSVFFRLSSRFRGTFRCHWHFLYRSSQSADMRRRLWRSVIRCCRIFGELAHQTLHRRLSSAPIAGVDELIRHTHGSHQFFLSIFWFMQFCKGAWLCLATKCGDFVIKKESWMSMM
jgi:hypothetical protein